MKRIFSVVIAMIVFLSHCFYVGAENDRTVNLCTYRTLGDFSPYTVKDDTEYEAMRFLFDSLYYIDENDRSKEMMGHSLSISEDFSEYRITLRDDIKWTDGNPVTVEDVIFTFENAKNVDWYKNAVRSLDRVYADGNTVVFKLKYPNPVFMKEAVTYIPVVPKLYYSAGEYNTVSCGAFRLDVKERDRYVLKSNEYYLTTTNVDTINIDILGSKEECSRAVIDARYATVFGNLDADSFKTFDDDLLETVDIYGLTSEVLFMNNETVFKDIVLRRAVSATIDYEKIVNDIYKQEAQKGSPGFFISRLGYANKDLSYETNIDSARAMLTNEGYIFDGGLLKTKENDELSINILCVSEK
ncbi:MAG: hypothetical protein IIW54_14125, partial [Lachnospiraceae bacterium]|nr:hypothetical protein [Lachnospiraceae bacterium]